jgi:hypothetical protein
MHAPKNRGRRGCLPLGTEIEGFHVRRNRGKKGCLPLGKEVEEDAGL